MKSRIVVRIVTIALFATMAIPAGLAAQHGQGPHNHHRYRLIDLGTLGGPSMYFCNDLNSAGGACAILNNRGTVVSSADTSISNPNYPNVCLVCPPSDPFIVHAFQWQDGSLTDLGALPGGYNSFANSISQNGLIAGASENGSIDPLLGVPEVDAVLWKAGEMVNLGVIEGGYESNAFAVNERGQAAGVFLNTVPDPFSPFGLQLRAFSWKNGIMQDVGTLGTGTDAWSYWINERGQVAGASFTNTIVNPVLTYCTAFQIETPTQDPFLWDNGKLIDLGTLGGTCGVPNAINNGGQVIGLSDTAGDTYYHAFIWPGKDRKMQDLGTLGGCCAIANWLNDAGAVVGGSWTTNDQEFHAFLWKNGVMTDLGPAGACTMALGINSSQQVVGFSCGNTAALLWDHGQNIDLNIFNHPGSGLQYLALAYNINDGGEIVGLGVPPGCGDVFSCGHAFVLTPCDEHHPGIDGCDYSMVEGTVAAAETTPALRDAIGRPQAPVTIRRGYRFHTLGAAIGPKN